VSIVGFGARASASSITTAIRTQRHPGRVGVAVNVSVETVPAVGGIVVFRIRARSALWCGFSISPSANGFGARVPCHDGAITHNAVIGPNRSLAPVEYIATVRVRGTRHFLTRRVSITQAAAPSTVASSPPVSLYGLYGNGGTQAVGDCTIATVGELLQTWDVVNGLNSGPLASPPFIAAYQTLVGGPGGPDVGLSVKQVLNYWQRVGIDGNQITTWHAIKDYTSRALVEDEIAKYGTLYASFQVPSSDVEQTAGTTLWSTNESPPGRTTVGDHAAALIGYDTTGPYFATWGRVQQATWAWWSTWAIGADVVVPGKGAWTPNVVMPTTTALQQAVTIAEVNGSQMWAVNLTATVNAINSTPGGDVTFYDNGQPITGCDPATNGIQSSDTFITTCTVYVSTIVVRSDTYYAQFSGDISYADSSSNPTSVNFGG